MAVSVGVLLYVHVSSEDLGPPDKQVSVCDGISHLCKNGDKLCITGRCADRVTHAESHYVS